MCNSTSGSESETITLHELLERSARTALDLQREDGSFPPGRNGIYDEPETPLRSTSHWLTILSRVYEITGDEVFASAAHDSADYLLSSEARPYEYTFHSRNTEGKDKCDGVIGQAAPIRGLSYAGNILNRPELLETAREVFLLHPFDERLGLWERVEIDGTPLSFDRTMNHQLVFAAASSNLCDAYVDVEQRILQFLDCLESNLCVRSDGIVRQYIKPSLQESIFALWRDARHWKLIMNWIVATYYNFDNVLLDKERGYFPVNARGLAELRSHVPEHDIWTDSKIRTISKRVERVYEEEQLGGKMGSLVPRFHLGYSLCYLCLAERAQVAELISDGIRNKYNFDNNRLDKNAIDTNAQSRSIWILSNLDDFVVWEQ